MLDDLYFGKDDAESDIGRAGLLARSFVETAAYRSALEGRKWLILGRKGSGKSAIALMILRSFSDANRCSFVTPDEISAEEVKRFDLAGVAPYQSKELLWRYIFAVQIAKFLLNYDKTHRLTIETEILSSKVRQFLIDNNETDDLTAVERFWRIIDKLKINLKIGAFGGEVSAGAELASGVRLSSQVDVVETNLLKFATELGLMDQQGGFYLLVDQIERIWSNDPGSDALVIGLLRAGKHIQNFYPFVTCIAFLRIDIYEKLNFTERDKLRSDELTIKWGRDDLLNLVVTRAQVSTSDRIDRKSIWTKVFPRRFGDTDVRTYLASKTLNRPRDIIQLCNACRDVARSKGRTTITAWDIGTATAQYSRWKFVDIQNEWAVNYPFLTEAMLLISNGSYLFSRKEFTVKYNELNADLITRYPESQKLMSPDFLLSILFVVGVIGVVRNADNIYFHENDQEEKLRIQDDQFIIHPGFRDSLQSTSAINLTPFEQNPEIAIETARAARSRLSRATSSGTISAYEDSTDAPAYFLSELLDMVTGARKQLVDQKIALEIQDEIRTNLTNVESELRGISRIDDEMEQADSLSRIGIFFRKLGKGLVENNVIEKRSDLLYSISRIDEMCRAYQTAGFRRRYRGSYLA